MKNIFAFHFLGSPKKAKTILSLICLTALLALSSCQNPFQQGLKSSTLESTNSNNKALISAEFSEVTESFSSATADGTQVTITVTVLDSAKKPVSGKVMALSSSRSSYDSLSTVLGTTDKFGKATFTVSSTKTGTSVYTASFGGGSSGNISDTASVTYTPGPATKLSFASQPGSAIAGTSFATQPVVQLLDQYNNVVTTNSSTSVTVALSSGTGTLSGTKTLTASAGVASFSGLSINLTGTKQLVATASSLTSASGSNFIVTANSPSVLYFTSEPGNTTAGSAFAAQPVVEIRDAYTNVVTSATDTVALAIQSGTGSITGTSSVAAVAGVATFSGLKINTAGAKVLRASSGSLTTDDTASFTISPASATKLAFTTSPGNTVADTAFAAQPVITIQDAYDNTVTSATDTIALAVQSGTGSLVGTSSVAAVAGVATFSGLKMTVTGTKTLRASSGSLTTADSSSFTITAGAATQLVFTTEPGNTTAGSAFAAQPVVEIRDANNNLVTSATDSVALAIQSGTGSITGTSSVAAVAGVATFSGLQINTAGAKVLRASSGSLTTDDTASFTISPASAAKLAFTTSPGNTVADTAFAAQPVITIQDAYDNTVTSATDTIALAVQSGTGSLVGTSSVAAVAGVATFSGLKMTVTGTKTLRASSGSLTTADSSSFTITAGSATQLVFTTEPGNTTAGSAFAAQPVVEIRDANNNLVTSATDSVVLTIQSGTGSITGTSSVAAVAGVATFSGLQINTAGAKVLRASSGSLTTDDTASFTISPATAAKLAFSSQPGAGVAGTSFATQPVVLVQDAYDNTVTSDSSTSITIALTSGTGSLSGTVTKTVTSGSATYTGLSIDIAGTGKVLTASASGLTDAVGNSFTVTPGSATQLVFTTEPGNTTAGSAFAAQPVVEIRDANNNLVTSATDSVVLTIQSGTGSITGTSSVAAVAGVATFSGLQINTAGAKVLRASSGSLTTDDTASFTISPASAAKLAFSSQPGAGVAGTSFATQPVVLVQDAYDNTVTSDSSTSITIALTSGTGSLSGTVTKTVTSGSATYTGLSIDIAGTGKVLTASASGLTDAVGNSFTVTPGSATQLVFTTEPGNTTAGSAFAAQPVVELRDANNNLVTSATDTVALAIQSGTGSITGTSSVAAVAGVATFAGLQINTAGAKVLRASSGSLTTDDTASFTISAASATKLAFSSQPGAGVAGTSFATQPVVLVQDAYDNTVTSDSSTSITIALTSGTGSLSGTVTKTVTSGSATYTGLSIDVAGTGKVLTASASGLTDAVGNSFTVTPGSATQLVFTTEPGNTTAGSAFAAQPVVELRDANNNLVTSATDTVALAIQSGTGSITGTSSVAAVAGVATFAGLQINTAGAKVLRASSGSLTTDDTASFTISAASATKLAFTTSPGNTVADTAFAAQPVITIQDAYDNTVTSATDTIALAVQSGTGSLVGTSSVAAVAGVATFSGLKMTVTGTKTLRASSGSLTTADSSSFDITAGAATQLVFTTEPGNTTAGSAFAAQPVVEIRDANNNLVTSATDPVALAIQSGTGSITGTSSVSAVAGVATFAGLQINTAGAKVLRASSGSLTTDDTASFTISAASASKLGFTSSPSSGYTNIAFSTQPVVAVQDAYNNTITGSSASIALSISAGSLSGTTTVAASSGVATFSGLSATTAGSKTLTATSTGLTSATTSSFTVSDPETISDPTNLTATPGDQSVSLSWGASNASTGSVTYTVKRGTSSGSHPTTVTSGLSATTYSDTGLTNGTSYYYVIVATNGSVTSNESNEVESTPLGCSSSMLAYTSTQSITVPSNCNYAYFMLWGASGGPGGICIGACLSKSGLGGPGGYAAGLLSVTPSESLDVSIGSGGGKGTNGGGSNYSGAGGGGGATGLKRSSTTHLVAGGGGGGGSHYGNSNYEGANGGSGGGSSGSSGSSSNTANGGGGGTNAAAGSGGTAGSTNGSAGSGSTGGAGAAGGATNAGGSAGTGWASGGAGGGGSWSGGGGGGGGYYGGGGGGTSNGSSAGAGGGGGSSYVSGSVSSSTLSTGSGLFPAQYSSAFYQADYGMHRGWGNGGNSGRVAVVYSAGNSATSAPSNVTHASQSTIYATPYITWTHSNTGGLPVAYYQVAIGSTVGGTDVLNWTSSGLNTFFGYVGLSLNNGTTYYASVRAVDVGGNVSSSASNNSGFTATTSLCSAKSTYTSAGTTSVTVPSGCTTAVIKSWGAGGGASGGGRAGLVGTTGKTGGAGAFAGAVVSVVANETLTVKVGGGGGGGKYGGWASGGGGGGSSAVVRGAIPLAVAGAGAGAGPGGIGGDGGTNVGGTGGAIDAHPGTGGTQSTGGYGGYGYGSANLAADTGSDGSGAAGGAGGTNTGHTPAGGTAGTGYGAGGAGGTGNWSGGGGGGGGYYGGGGGGRSSYGGGGGGGSSYSINGLFNLQAGSSGTAANNSDADYSGTAGNGGTGVANSNGNDGAAGRVVIIWGP